MISTIQSLFRALVGLVTPWVVLAPWEAGVRIRLGREAVLLRPGLNWIIPGIDRVSVQSTRLRVCTLQVQTLSTGTGRTLVLCGIVGYAIADILRLYNTLHHAEDTIKALVAEAVAVAVQGEADPTPEAVTRLALQRLGRLEDYGLTDVTVALTDFAFVRCYRIVNDQKWGGNGDILSTAVLPRSQAGL